MNGLQIDYNSSKKCNFGGPQNTPLSPSICIYVKYPQKAKNYLKK